MRKTIAVATKELRQIGRDRRTLLILLFVPAMFLLLYGYALNFDIRNVRLAVEDRDRSSRSRALVSAFVNSGYFDLAADVTTAGEIERLIDRNEVRAALVIPSGYGRDVLDRRPVEVQIIIDGDNSNTATTVIGYAQAIVAEVAASELVGVSPAAAAGARADRDGTARLVQPAASQHAVPRARPDRLHRDDHGRDLDRALGGARERARDDGAGPDVAGQSRRLRRREDDSVSRALVRLGAPHHPRRDGSVRSADARLVGAAVAGDRALPRRRAGAGARDLERRADPAGGVSAGAAVVVSADVHPVRLHLSDHQHADGRFR